MYRAYRFRLYPTTNQIELIHKTFGCTRVVYNYYLEKQKALYDEGKDSLSCFDMIKDLKNLQVERPYLKEVDSCSLRCSLFNLEDAFKRWYKEQGEYPKFKGKYNSKRSYRTNCISSTYKDKTYQSIEVDLKRHIIKLLKLKEVSIKGYRDLEYYDLSGISFDNVDVREVNFRNTNIKSINFDPQIVYRKVLSGIIIRQPLTFYNSSIVDAEINQHTVLPEELWQMRKTGAAKKT